ncbi:MAG: MotA/TolQ/ExbB proton channel family protein [Oscillospiraceae bacterium]|nr:MotA/TolQ/ExbB proton channel family protein [Oscillospiraceae bacterium]
MKDNILLVWIRDHGVAVIILLGIALLVAMIVNFLKLSNEKSRIKELLERRNKKYRRNKQTHELEEDDDETSTVTEDTIRKYENDFNEHCSWHNAFEQLIPIFPMLGILGTVAGLIIGLKNGTTGLQDAMETSLDTTFAGLIFAILLKGIDALLPSKAIYDVEVMLDDFDRKLDLSEKYSD